MSGTNNIIMLWTTQLWTNERYRGYNATLLCYVMEGLQMWTSIKCKNVYQC